MTAWMYTGPPAPRTARESYEIWATKTWSNHLQGHQVVTKPLVGRIPSWWDLTSSCGILLLASMAAWLRMLRMLRMHCSPPAIQLSASNSANRWPKRTETRWLGPHLNILYNHIPTHICHSPSTYSIHLSGTRDQVTDASRTRWRTCACQQWFRSWAHNPRYPAAHHLGKLRGAAGPRGDSHHVRVRSM